MKDEVEKLLDRANALLVEAWQVARFPGYPNDSAAKIREALIVLSEAQTENSKNE